MDKLFKLRNRPYKTVVVVGVLGCVLLLWFLRTPITRSVLMILHQRNTPIRELSELELVDTGDLVVIISDELIDSGYGYFYDGNLLIDYTLTSMSKNYVLLVQPIQGAFTKTVLSDSPIALVVRVVDDSDSQRALNQIVADFKEHYSLTEELAWLSFSTVRLELVGVVGNVQMWPLIIVSSWLIMVVLMTLVIKNRSINQLKRAVAYEDALEIVEEIQSPLYETSQILLTQHYLIHKHAWSMKRQFVKHETIAWMHMHQLNRKYLGLPIGTQYSIVIYTDKAVRPLKIVMKRATIEHVLTVFDGLYSDVIIGYREGWLEIWLESLSKDVFVETIQKILE